MRAFLFATLAALAAFAAGYWLGRQPRAQQEAPPGPVGAASAPAAASIPAALPVLLDVELAGSGMGQSGPVTALVLGTHHRVVLPLEALDGAETAFVRTPDDLVPIGPVVGVLPAAGLVALSGPEGRLQVSEQSASLRLGLGVAVIDHQSTVAGEVESAGTRLDDGSYAYRINLTTPIAAGLAPLTDESGGELIGAITHASGESGSYDAVDAGALQALAGSETAPLEIAEFARRFFTERPEGRLIRFRHAIAAGDWDTAIALGRDLHDLGWSYSDAVSAPLSNAYLEAARRLHDQPSDAIALLDEAAATLGEDAPRLQERAQLLSALDQPFAALRALSAAARLDPGLREDLRRAVLAVASQTALATDDRIGALNEAIGDDPTYAPYSAALGRLYYGQGMYVDAAATLENALGQDPALDAELGTLLATARQRLRTPGETIAPLHSNGASLYVYANVGGRFLRFIVDTGATYTALSARAARSLGIVGVADDQQVVLSTAGGYVNAPLVTLGSIDVNGAVVQHIPVVVLDSTVPYDGLLGMSFLDHFDVSIDRRAGQMRLMRR